MSAKQEPRPAYHRRNDLKRLQEMALPLPGRIVVSDETVGNWRAYTVRDIRPGNVLIRGRYQIVAAYLQGWTDAKRIQAEAAGEPGYVPSLET